MKAPAVVKLAFRHVVDDQGLTVLIDGLRIRSEPNIRQHWAAKHPRKKSQELIVREAFHHARPFFFKTGPLAVRFHRIGGKRMDVGNLGAAFKFIEDELFRAIGRDDGEQEIKITYTQEPARVRGYFGIQMSIDRL